MMTAGTCDCQVLNMTAGLSVTARSVQVGAAEAARAQRLSQHDGIPVHFHQGQTGG